MKCETSWDDGGVNDMRLADLLLKYQLPAVFFIPTCMKITEPDLKQLAKNFVIGGHTVAHPQDMKLLDNEQLKAELEENREWLKEVTGQQIMHFAYPRGRHDERVRKAVEAAGYGDARTTEVLSTSWMYKQYEKPTTIHAYQRTEYKGEDWLELGKRYFDMARDKGEIFHLWGHSDEVDKYNDWQRLETLFAYMHERLAGV